MVGATAQAQGDADRDGTDQDVHDTAGDQAAARQHPGGAAVGGVLGGGLDPLPFVTDAVPTVHTALDTTD